MTGASTLAWMTLLLPLASAAVITLGTLKNHRLSANLSIGALFLLSWSCHCAFEI